MWAVFGPYNNGHSFIFIVFLYLLVCNWLDANFVSPCDEMTRTHCLKPKQLKGLLGSVCHIHHLFPLQGCEKVRCDLSFQELNGGFFFLKSLVKLSKGAKPWWHLRFCGSAVSLSCLLEIQMGTGMLACVSLRISRLHHSSSSFLCLSSVFFFPPRVRLQQTV